MTNEQIKNVITENLKTKIKGLEDLLNQKLKEDNLKATIKISVSFKEIKGGLK